MWALVIQKAIPNRWNSAHLKAGSHLGRGGESKHGVVGGLWYVKEARPTPFLENRQALRGSPAFEEIVEQMTMGK